MPLFLSNGEQLKEFDYKIIQSDPVLKENAKLLIDNRKDEYEPFKCLYIGQREYATVKSDDPFIDVIGSDAATTCHIGLIIDSSNKNASQCHFDGSEMENGIEAMIYSLKKLRSDNITDTGFDLYLVGGFDDLKKHSIKTTLSLINYFIQSTETFNLKLCFVTKLNNTIKNNVNYPIVYGLGYNLKTCQIFMCNQFKDKGPDLGVRGARHFSESENYCVYDPLNYRLVIGPFNYEPMDYVERYLRIPNEVLLKYFSTSPEQEPPDFLDSLKRTFQAMIDHPNPLQTYFKDKANIYKKNDTGQWIKVD